jgi:hypothetical protein
MRDEGEKKGINEKSNKRGKKSVVAEVSAL